MSALDQLEAFLQDLLERPAGLLMPRAMQPVQLASAITKAVEAAQQRLPDRIVIPSAYELSLSEEDFRKIASARPALERKLADYVERLAAERELSLPADPVVHIRPVAGLRTGLVRAKVLEMRSAHGSGTTRERAHSSDSRQTGALLVLLKPGGGALRQYRVEPPSVLVGRRSSNDVALPDLKVSRHHVRIECRSSIWYLVDLNSRNGTRINGQSVAGMSPLHSGDVIEMGMSRLRFESGAFSEEHN
jgi:hypothetical protein